METYIKPNVYEKFETMGLRLVGRPSPSPLPSILRKLFGDDVMIPDQPLTPRKSVE